MGEMRVVPLAKFHKSLTELFFSNRSNFAVSKLFTKFAGVEFIQ
jgi:hypothetical protein